MQATVELPDRDQLQSSEMQDALVVRQEMRTRGMLVDVFRVRNGLCVEHWDAYRPDPGTDRIPGSEVAREPAMTTTRTARSAR